MEPIIKLEKVNFYYEFGKPNQVHALKNINLEIKKGEFVAIFGPSGCGKTTLLYVIAGIEKPQQGNVFVLGKNLVEAKKEELAVYRQIGVSIIFQTFNLIPSIKVIDNITLPMAFCGISPRLRQERARELLKRLKIEELADRYPHELSGGQQQRVAIARALANDPPIILADEPVGNLDSENAKIVLKLLKEINQKDKKTIILVTHEAWTLKGTVNRIIYLKDGEIVGEVKITPRLIEKVKQIGTSFFWKELFPKLPRARTFAKSYSEIALRGYPLEVRKRFEEFFWQRLNKKIDSEKFKELLDLPFSQGGVGLWKQKAEKLSQEVEEILKRRRFLKRIYKKIEKNPADPLFEEVTKIEEFLLKDCQLKLSPLQRERFRELISNRLRNIILPEHVIKILDLPIEKGGVGLRINTALKVGKKIEEFLERK